PADGRAPERRTASWSTGCVGSMSRRRGSEGSAMDGRAERERPVSDRASPSRRVKAKMIAVIPKTATTTGAHFGIPRNLPARALDISLLRLLHSIRRQLDRSLDHILDARRARDDLARVPHARSAHDVDEVPFVPEID